MLSNFGITIVISTLYFIGHGVFTLIVMYAYVYDFLWCGVVY